MPFIKEKIELAAEEAQLEAREALFHFSRLQRFILLTCLIALIPSYFAAKYAVSFALSKSLEQTLVTAHTAFQNPEAPKISDITITKAGTRDYSAFAVVSNPNLELSLDTTPYEFRFYNSAGEQAATSRGNSLFLLPGKSAYAIAARVTSDQPLISGQLMLPDTLRWQKRLSVPDISLSASQPAIYNQSDPLAFVVEGTVTNSSAYRLKNVEIQFLLYDASGRVLGSSLRTESDFLPSERRAYKQLWPGIYTTEVTRVQVIPVTNPLDPDNLSLPADMATPASDLSRPNASP